MILIEHYLNNIIHIGYYNGTRDGPTIRDSGGVSNTVASVINSLSPIKKIEEEAIPIILTSPTVNP